MKQAGPLAARLGLLGGMLLLALATQGLVVLALLLVGASGLLISARRVRWRWLGLAAVFAVPYALLNAALVGTAPLLAAGPVTLHGEGLEAGARMAARGLLAAALGLWVLASTSPREAAAALQRFPTVAVAVEGTLRFAPLAARDWQRVREAQALRGHAPGKGWRATATDAVPLLVPLFVASVRRGQALQEALDAAAFGSGPRTRRQGPRWRVADVGLAALGLALMALGAVEVAAR